jgi:hypothetical protein
MDVENSVFIAVKDLLSSRLEIMPWHDFDLEPGYDDVRGELEVLCRQKADSEFLTKVLRAEFLHDAKQVYITNIFMPETMTHERLGKRVIKAMYEASAKHDYHLLLVDMVPSFYRRMLERSALRIDGDSVQILAKTNLLYDLPK